MRRAAENLTLVPGHAGSSKRHFTVCSSTTSTLLSGLSQPASQQPFLESLIHSIWDFTAAAVNGSPSEYVIPFLSFIRHVNGSENVHDFASSAPGGRRRL
jgi:hypothetical protein